MAMGNQSMVHLTEKSEVSGSIPGPATYIRGNRRPGICQLLTKVWPLSTE